MEPLIRPTPLTTRYITPDDQIELFTGCVYLMMKNKVRLPNGLELNKPRFDIHFNGFMFLLDRNNQRTTRSAWKAFTQSEAFTCPKVWEDDAE